MYNRNRVDSFVSFITEHFGIADKRMLVDMAVSEFSLVRDRSVFFCPDFAVRFCSSKKTSFSNTVLSLSALQKYDSIPFIVCLVTPMKNILLLSNTTFLRKVSHSSRDLRTDNIRGSFNGSDIMREFEGVPNDPAHFEFLFTSHENFSFADNLERLVGATNDIQPTGRKYMPTDKEISCILRSVDRARLFLESEEYWMLNDDLQKRVDAVSNEIAIAAFIENVNLRGRIIEYLITSSNELRRDLIDALHANNPLPEVYTADELGDYHRRFECFDTETDIKTKILFLSSNPKGYNIDKLLSFLAKEESVYLVYIIAIDERRQISTRLCSIFNRQLLNGTRIIHHWAGRNSRGVTQYDGQALECIVSAFDSTIDKDESERFICKCLDL